MVRLIKAEWYRITHTGMLKWFVIVCLLMPILAMLSSVDWYSKSLSENMMMCAEIWTIFVPLFIAVAVSVSIAMSYQSRLMLYEIMDGANVHTTLLSRLILYVVFFTLSAGLCTMGYLGILAAVNGIGEFNDVEERVVLFVIVLVHICMVAALLSLLVKKYLAIVCVVLRYCMIEEIGVFLYSMPIGINKEVMSRIADWFISGQISTILCGEITTHLVWASVFSLVIEGLLLYVLNVIFLKRKILP